MDISISKRKKWAWSHLEVTYVPLVTRLYAVIKTMWRMQIQLLCVSVLDSMGSRVKPCPYMGNCDVNKSHGLNARFWLVEIIFAALWLVSTPRGHYHYCQQSVFSPIRTCIRIWCTAGAVERRSQRLVHRPFRFSLSLIPRSTKGLFTG